MIIRHILRGILVIIFVGGGINHFINSDFYFKIMPQFLPYPVLINYASGALEIIGGVGLLISGFRKSASYLLILLLILFLIVHIDHVVKGGVISNETTLPQAAVWFRLLFQGVLIYWVYWVGKK